MIAKAPGKGKYGKDTYGLLRYLFGPGRSNEHTAPHLVAAWDPEWLDGGLFAEHPRGWLARLAREVDAPMTGHGVELDGGHVYHVALSIPSQDGRLGDARWRALVEEAIDRMGFGPADDGRAGCRWVAVHHGQSKDGNDHVHLVVNLVRGDGTIADTYRDWPRWRTWCRDVEQRLGLTSTSLIDKTAAIRPTRAEVEKANRGPQPRPSRDMLREAVRAAAAEASNAAEFIELLHHEPLVTVHPRWDPRGRLSGYRVALFSDHSKTSADGRVWYSGSSLAHDLSAPKLMNRWSGSPTGPRRDSSDLLRRATAATDDACRHVAALVAAGDISDGSGGDDIAHATADLVLAVSKTIGGAPPCALADAAVAYEWVAVAPHRVQPVWWSPVAVELRTAARDLLRAGALARRTSMGVAAAALLVALAALLTEVAAWRDQAGQNRQAAAAQRAADLVHADSVTRERVGSPRAVARSQMTTTPRPRPDQPARIRRYEPSRDLHRGRTR